MNHKSTSGLGLHLLEGAVNCGLLVHGDDGVLIDCCDTTTPRRLLEEQGVKRVRHVFCTQHARTNVAGLYHFDPRQTTIHVPARVAWLFDDVESFWSDDANRWHVYHFQPSSEILPRNIGPVQPVHEGDVFNWHDWVIEAVETPGVYQGAISYIVRRQGNLLDGNDIKGETVACFCGDLLAGPGKVKNLHALQGGFRKVTDYHGFLGNLPALESSIEHLAARVAAIGMEPAGSTGTSIRKKTGVENLLEHRGNRNGKRPNAWKLGLDDGVKSRKRVVDGDGMTTLVVPSHGVPFTGIEEAGALLARRLHEVLENFVSISSLNHHFPGLFPGKNFRAPRMKPARMVGLPRGIRRIPPTSFLIVSARRRGFLIDCGSEAVVRRLKRMVDRRRLNGVDACWITHYHDDHVDGLPALEKEFGCPVLAVPQVATVLERPGAFFLPCISPVNHGNLKVVKEGHRWEWEEFMLVAHHLPGQSLYHGGLLVESERGTWYFTGDSATPAGIDDYCPANRNFIREGTGNLKCIETWQSIVPGEGAQPRATGEMRARAWPRKRVRSRAREGTRAREPVLFFNQHMARPFILEREHFDFMREVLRSRGELVARATIAGSPDLALDPHWVRFYPYDQPAKAGGSALVEVHVTNHLPRPVTVTIEPVAPPGWRVGGQARKEGGGHGGGYGGEHGGENGGFGGAEDGYGGTVRENIKVPPLTSGLALDGCGTPDGKTRFTLHVPLWEKPGTHVVTARITLDGRYIGQACHGLVRVAP